MTQHAALTRERWSRFSKTQQVLQIAAEMQRAIQFLQPDHMEWLRAGYERVLRLVDLTVQVQTNRGLRRELLRWRGVIAELYLRDEPDAPTHAIALRVLLELDAEAAGQIQYLGL
jgi:hypothetical protein